MEQLVSRVVANVERFLLEHSVEESIRSSDQALLNGGFALRRGLERPDLYGMVDAVYILHTIGKLQWKTNRESRQVWAQRILACQDEEGWFSKLNLRGHSREHATAYAIGALKLLELERDEHHLECIRPIVDLLPILTRRSMFLQWIDHLGFQPSLRGVVRKNLGWHYIWRGSHVGAGIAAIVSMTSQLFRKWWPEVVDSERWFNWYFDWLDDRVDPKTGYWRRAFWNRLYCQPTIVDLGGAVHFLWVYEALGRPFQYPEQIVLSTLGLQKKSGLYRNHPFCIDLDGTFCVIRPFLQLTLPKRRIHRQLVHQSVEASFTGIAKSLGENPLREIYSDSHGLPGALAALAECAKLPDFKYAEAVKHWQHPLDRVCWL